MLKIITSYGISFGTVYKIKNIDLVNKKYINKIFINDELNKFILNYYKTIKDLYKIRERSKKIFNDDKNKIFEGQIILLKNKEFIDKIKFLIKNSLYSCEYAIYKVINSKINEIKNINNEYLKSRILDIKDICIRLINNIKNNKLNFLSEYTKNKFILVSNYILPSYILQFNLEKIVGIISKNGSYNSHSSIIARSLKIPMIIGINNLNILNSNDFLILDAINNNLYINPTSIEIKNFNNTVYNNYLKKKKNKKIKNILLKTKDNFKINLYFNINIKNEINYINEFNCINGIGLYRTEFLFNNKNNLLDEEYQFLQYKKIALLYKNKIVNIRVLNIEKNINYDYFNTLEKNNLNLGLKGIRFLFRHRNILYNQIKSILRASYFGNIRILFPMISVIEEIFILKKIINKIKKNLYEKNIPFNKNIKIGIMLETPSISIILKYIINEIDFFVVGVNDLTQYLLASNRNNKDVLYLHNFLYPSVIIFLKKIIDFLNKNNKELYICNEQIEYKKFIILLIGMGVNSISINTSYALKSINLINRISFKDSKILVKKILKQTKIKDVIYLLNQFNN